MIPLASAQPARGRNSAYPDQTADRFLALHQTHFVTCWQWILGGGMLRATADTGETATISRDELEQLVTAGIVERIGTAGVRLCGC